MKEQKTPLQRVLKILDFNHKRGNNKESVNKVYRNIINQNLKEYIK